MTVRAVKHDQWKALSPRVAVRAEVLEPPMKVPGTEAVEWLRNAWQEMKTRLARTWKQVQARNKARMKSQKLKVCETAQLGDKRFVALVQADGQRFLIGGTGNNIALLAALPSNKKNFRSLLPKEMTAEALEP